jgi:hypothetical protein
MKPIEEILRVGVAIEVDVMKRDGPNPRQPSATSQYGVFAVSSPT